MKGTTKMLLLNEFDSIDKLFFTLSVIILITNIIYQFMAKFNRPIVLGGIMAGIIIHHLHIPTRYFDINTCAGLGQMGIVLFMMTIGNQLDYKNVFRRKTMMPISLLNVLVPFILGVVFATLLIKHNLTGLYDLNKTDTGATKSIIADDNLVLMFKLFIGLAVSMTAFPILSMFLRHSELINSLIGRVAMLCGFVNEVFFWLVLGVVLVSVQKNGIITSFEPFDIIFYLLFIVLIAPRIVKFCINRIKTERGMMSFLIIGCFISAALADSVDLHQVFGGFLFGLILPRNNTLIITIQSRLSEFAQIILLPIYFVETGITANIHVSVDYLTFYLTLGFTLIALIGKFGGGFLTGKILGYSNSDSTFLGAILNMRGIIEIVLLNVGLDVGIINEKLYTTLVGMTLICNFLATSLTVYLSKHPQKRPS